MKKGKYCRKITRAGCTVDVQFTYPTRFGEGLTRAKHRKTKTEENTKSGTPADVEAYNYELAVRKLTLILNENFTPDDWFVTLHYEKENRPESIEEARRQLTAFLKELKKSYIGKNLEFKWVKTTAYGCRGALHHHIAIPKGVTQRQISLVWKETVKASIKARPPECRALYSTGEYSALAAYFCQQAEISGTKERNMRRWTCSRNIKRPEPEAPKWVDKVKWQEPPVPWPGYYIDTDSIRAGCNPVTGKPYLFYRMIKLPPDFTCYDNKGKRLTGKSAVKYYRENNKDFIKQNWIDINPEGEVIFKTGKGLRQDE